MQRKYLMKTLSAVCMFLIPGCALSSGRSQVWQGSAASPVILASDFGDAVPLQDDPQDGGHTRDDKDRQRPVGPLDRLGEQPTTTQPGGTATSKPAFTWPTGEMKGAAMLGFFTAATDVSRDENDRGREAAESAVMSGVMPGGLTGVGPAAQPAPDRIIGQIGLQEGAPLFGASINDTRIARPNRVDPNCRALTRAGFFGGSFSQCRAQFRR